MTFTDRIKHIEDLLVEQRAALSRGLRGTTAEMHRALDEADRLADLLQRRVHDMRPAEGSL